MKKALLIGGSLVALVSLFAANQLRQFTKSINFYITSLGMPKFSNGYLEVPTRLSFINHSIVPITIDSILINFYQYDGATWNLLGTSNPQQEKIRIGSSQTTEITLIPRVAILQGLIPGLLSFLKGGGRKFRVGVAIRIAGQMMPEQFKEFSLAGGMQGFDYGPNLVVE